MATTPIYLELGNKKVFAASVDWPGWCRSGKSEEAALESLAAYASRYAAVAHEAGVRWPKSVADHFDVVERVDGGSTTDFGVIGAVPEVDALPTTAADGKRLARLLSAAWTVLDRVAADSPAELRKGPRGGGRDRDKMLQHVVGAEAGYARKLGVRHPEPTLGDTDAIAALRADVLAVLQRPSDGSPLVEKGWPVRYAARRFAWHVLDHAWEMEDRREPA